MGSEQIISTDDKSTAEFVDALGNNELPVAKVRRKLGWRKVNKALTLIGELAKEASASIQKSATEALSEIGESMAVVDVEMRHAIEKAAEDVGVDILEVFKKKHEGKVVDHVRLKPGVEVKKRGKTTVFKVAK